MAEPGFYNNNARRAYPLLPKLNRETEIPDNVLVDCGFVIGVGTSYQAGDILYLREVSRTGNAVSFQFEVDSSEPIFISVTADLSGPDYQTAFAEVSESNGDCNDRLVIEGFIVVGRIRDIELFIGDNETRPMTNRVVEPAVIQDLSKSFIEKVKVGNLDRTRTATVAGCPEIDWHRPPGEIYIVADCLTGNLEFKPGYNATIVQNPLDNAILFGASVGAGLGEPCEEIEVYPDEEKAEDPISIAAGDDPVKLLPTFDGGFRCNDVLRSFNGVGGKSFTISAGLGVTIDTEPAENKILVDVDFSQLSACQVESEE